MTATSWAVRGLLVLCIGVMVFLAIVLDWYYAVFALALLVLLLDDWRRRRAGDFRWFDQQKGTHSE